MFSLARLWAFLLIQHASFPWKSSFVGFSVSGYYYYFFLSRGKDKKEFNVMEDKNQI